MVQGPGAGDPGGRARVRAPGVPHLTQVAVVLSGAELRGRVVHRDRQGDRAGKPNWALLAGVNPR